MNRDHIKHLPLNQVYEILLYHTLRTLSLTWMFSGDSLRLMSSLLKSGDEAASDTSKEVRPLLWQ